MRRSRSCIYSKDIYDESETLDDDGKHVEMKWTITPKMVPQTLRELMFPKEVGEEAGAEVAPANQSRPPKWFGLGA